MSGAKKQKVEEVESESVGSEEFDQETQAALEELEKVQDDLSVLEEQQAEEIMKVIAKYAAQMQPLYQLRKEKISKVPNFWFQAVRIVAWSVLACILKSPFL